MLSRWFALCLVVVLCVALYTAYAMPSISFISVPPVYQSPQFVLYFPSTSSVEFHTSGPVVIRTNLTSDLVVSAMYTRGDVPVIHSSRFQPTDVFAAMVRNLRAPISITYKSGSQEHFVSHVVTAARLDVETREVGAESRTQVVFRFSSSATDLTASTDTTDATCLSILLQDLWDPLVAGMQTMRVTELCTQQHGRNTENKNAHATTLPCLVSMLNILCKP